MGQVEGRAGAAEERIAREADLHHAVEVTRRAHRRGHRVAVRARDGVGPQGLAVERVGAGVGPRVGSASVAGAALALTAPEVDAAVEVQRVGAQRGAVGVGLGVARRARTRGMVRGGRAVTAPARERRAAAPRGHRGAAAAAVTTDGAGAAVVARVVARERAVEGHLHHAVAVLSHRELRAAGGVAGPAREPLRAEAWREVGGVGAVRRISLQCNASCRTGRAVDAVAGAAREGALGLGVAGGAGGRAGRAAGDVGGACGGALVAATAGVGRAGVEHEGPPRGAEHAAVKRGGARVADALGVHAREAGQGARANPRGDRGALVGREQVTVVGAVEGAEQRGVGAAVGGDRGPAAPGGGGEGCLLYTSASPRD